jgi:ribosomal protein L7/L12
MTMLPESIGLIIGALLILVALNSIAARLRAIEARIGAISRVEAKLDLLLQNAGLKYDPYPSVSRDVVEALRRGEKINAIKLYRQSSGVGLKEAKDAVEEMERRGGGGDK